jgi:hypothetical protein
MSTFDLQVVEQGLVVPQFNRGNVKFGLGNSQFLDLGSHLFLPIKFGFLPWHIVDAG